MNFNKFFSELERRKVYRVAIGYGIVAWLIAQIAGLILSSFEAPTWIMKIMIILLLIGFPVALILSWIFDLGPKGIVKTEALKTESFKEKKRITFKLAISILSLIAIIILVGWWSWKELTNDIQKPIQSIAVLPFDNFTNDQNQEALAAGLQDDLITTISKIRSLRVISRPSTIQYKNSDKSSTEIASELDVDAIIKASLLKFGDTVRINIQLIGISPKERNLWTESFERPAKDIYALFNKVSSSLAREINLSLSSKEKKYLSNASIVNPEAYKAYWSGNNHWDNLTPESLQKAFEYYDLAIKIDSSFAPAYAGIAAAWSGRKQMNLVDPKLAFEETTKFIEKAFQLDSLNIEVLYNYAISEGWMAWNWEKTIKAFERVLEINPSYAKAHAYYSNILMALGDHKKAMKHMEIAVDLDPINPVIQGLYHISLSANNQCDQIFKLHKDGELRHVLSIHGLRNCYNNIGILDKALELDLQLLRINPNDKALIMKNYQNNGYISAVLEFARTLEMMSENTFVSPLNIAHLYAQAHKKEEALKWLEIALISRDANLPYLTVIPFYDFMREDTRFKDILHQMNLPYK